MPGHGLYVMVEGPRDERFFDTVVRPRLRSRHLFVKPYRYGCRKHNTISSFVQGIMPPHDYILLVDLDEFPCVTERKRSISSWLSMVDPDKIMVVKKEIEGWYLAGLSEPDRRRLGVTLFGDTESLTADHFREITPRSFSSCVNFMEELLKCFSIPMARRRNSSFDYLVRKYFR